MNNRLSQLSDELDVDAITLLKLVKKLKKPDELTEDDVEDIKRALTGYYELSDKDIRSIDDFLYTDKGANLLK